MIPIPQELLDQFERGNVLLFVGERIGRDAEGHILVDQLVTELATRCGIDSPEEYTFPEMAQIYEDEMGRNALVQLVRDQLEALGEEPKQVHRLIAGLTECTVLVTTGLDRRLERAFEEMGRPFDLIIGNVDLPFVGEGKTQLYKLRGSVERVESLVLTEADYETFFEDQASISVVLRGELARKTTVFAGYDLSDQHFTDLYRKVTAGLDTYARRAYAFGETPSAKVYRWCKRNNIQVIEVHATAYLQELAKQLKQIHPQPAPVLLPPEPQPPTPIPERPYKLLDSYQARDEAIFYGRAQDTRRFTSLIHAHRLALLYGASGTGKTSLLQAGVLPQLERADPPYATIRVRALEDPALVIRRAVRRRLPEADLPEDGLLIEFLDAAAHAIDRTLIIVLDQFEEFFIRFSPKYRASFIAELARLYEARNVPVKVVFSLREDWLASMSEIEERIPEVYQTKMRLLPLSRDQARQAITEPAEQLGMHYDPALVDRLLGNLADEQVDELTGSQSTSVMPPQLQLVCDALYERARGQGRDSITMADYEAMGGARDILARYIQEALREHPGEEREVAKKVLGSLVSSQATKTAMGQGSITAEVGAEDEVLERVLSRLIRQRLVRRLDVAPAYELAHDILADAIAGWIGEEDRQFKQAREMLRRELADWQQDPAVFLSQSKFQRINTLRDGLTLTNEEAAFLLRAAVLYDEDVRYWLEQFSDTDAGAKILLEMLGSDADGARLTAAKYLADYPQDDVATALAHKALKDPEPAVRDMAAISLGRMEGRTGISLLVDTVSDKESVDRARGLYALALIQEVARDQLVDLARPIQRQVTLKLAKINFWRDWPRIRLVTGIGAVAGALGFGLGFTPPIALHFLALLAGPGSLLNTVFIAPLLAVFGLLAGAVMALGISSGETLFSRRPRVGRILGGTLLGGLGFAVILAPLAIVDATAPLDAVSRIVGGGLSGVLIGLGITVPAVITPRRAAALVGGAVGGSLGIVIWGALGFKPFHPFQGGTVPLPVLLVSGGLVGLILAFSIVWAEARWPLAGQR
jgi:Cdc6-like AAA superfamily ATPase